MSHDAPVRITLRQLCSLGLPAPLLLPALLPVLRELVPASHAGFFFCDEAGSITNLYAERMLSPQAMATFDERHSQRQFRQQYLQRVQAKRPVSRRSVPRDEDTGGYREDVLGPLQIAHFLYAVVRHQGHALGQLSLYRGEADTPFTEADEDTLASVLHYLGEGLVVPAPQPGPQEAAQPVEDGLAVFDAQGSELYADDNWPRLVRLAQGQKITPATARVAGDLLPRFVSAVLATLTHAPLAVHRVESAWGQFSFHRHALRAAQGPGAVALRITRLGAEPLRLAQGAAAAGLSPQQREVAVLMAQGHGNAAIAERLRVTEATANFHTRQVFARLEVHERSAVARALIAAAARSLA